jgi:hypothetical protein
MELEDFEPEPPIIGELRRVITDAFDEVKSESRLDLDYEVAETVRFEQGQVSWFDRLPLNRTQIQVRLSHQALSTVTGNLIHKSGEFLIVAGEKFEYLVNNKYLVGISGLDARATFSRQPNTISWLENVWFHDLCDRQVFGSWYLVGGEVVSGECLRSGFDAIDIRQREDCMTIPKRALVAAQIPLFG